MKTKLSVIVGTIALMCLVCWTIYGQKSAPAKVSWEYYVTGPSNSTEAAGKLADLGSRGWELVSVTDFATSGPATSVVVMYFKRPKEQRRVPISS